MLFVTFKAGAIRYALEAHKVIGIVPLVKLRACAGAPDYIAGIFNYRGDGVPVIDLLRLTAGAACVMHLSTRIILVPYAAQNGRQRTIGLMAESVTETVEKETADFNESGLTTPGTPYLGKLAADESEFIQQVVIEQLLPKELESMLFAASEKEGAK